MLRLTQTDHGSGFLSRPVNINKPTRRRESRVGLVVLAWVLLEGGLLPLLGGCGGANWFKNGLLDPTQVGQFADTKRNEIRQSLSILEQPLGIQTAEEPSSEDLRPSGDELPIGPGDVLVINIFELLAPGQPTVQQVRIGHAGIETVPMVGPVRMSGLTPRQLELELKRLLREGGLIENADVQVTVSQSQYAQYSVVGSVGRAGVYPIPQPDYRLLTAIAAAGGIPYQIETIYVFQNSGSTLASDRHAAPPAEEVAPVMLSEMSSGRARGVRQPPDQPKPPAESEPAEEMPGEEEGEPDWDEERGEWVIREKEPAPKQPAVVAEPVGVGEQPAPPPDEPPVVVKPAPATPAEEAAAPSLEPVPPAEPSEAVSESELAPPVRILEIPVKELMDGDPRYNIVIRPYDIINVPPGNVGDFYMMGNIARPGAYTLTGRRLTVKEAVASAGGFGPLAWPARADLIRRVTEDEEQIIQLDLDKIFAGEAPDFYLKPNDMVNVGTTPAAMFFAVLRNAFRFTYGMGFVYDRNFGDADTFQAKEQLKARRNAEAQARGLPW